MIEKIEEDEFGEVTDVQVDVKEVLENVALVDTGDEDNEVENTESLTNDNQTEPKQDEVIAKDNEVEVLDDTAQKLFNEFSEFMEKKAGLSKDKSTKELISTGIDLVDAILGGGFIVGALNMIVGQPGSGKTMLATQTLAQGQKQYNGQLLGGFLDSEEATTKIRLSNLGVRYPTMEPYDNITIEKVFRFVEGLCVFKSQKNIVDIPSVVIWDSIANTLSIKERETDDPNSIIGYKARLLSILVPKYVAKCAQYNICLLAVNQLRDVLSLNQFSPAKDLKFMTATKDIPGGTTLKYNVNQLVEMKVKTAIAPGAANDSSKYGFEGIIVKLKCVKNKLFPPNIEVEVVGSFVRGFSNFWTNFNFLKATKRLNTGAWSYLVSLPDKKFRTKDAPQLYQEDEEFRKAYDALVKETIQTEIIDKYNPEIS